MERAIAVGFADKGKSANGISSSLEELGRLLETAGGRVERTVIQRRPQRDPATLVGRGKVEEIAALARASSVDMVVFDDELSPAQQRNLQEEIPAKIVDRTRLILDIFAQRARTKEGKLQVELAQLNYMLPRATERYGRFEQQVGGIGTRGPGERKLEIEQRHIRNRIGHIKKQISQVRNQRALQRENRERIPLPIVALIGYTNVGKSSLLNALHPPSDGSAVYADDKLFATLDPTTRRVKLPGGRISLFVDTVGFIQKLPHHLVAAFHSTLEEAREAHLLIHVVDAANPHWLSQFNVVNEVLKDLKAQHVPQLTVLNKADLLTPSQRAVFQREGRLLVSAGTKEGLEPFLKTVEMNLDQPLLEKEFFLPHQRRDLLSAVYQSGRVLEEKPVSGGTRLRVRLDLKNWGRLEKELGNTKDAAHSPRSKSRQ